MFYKILNDIIKDKKILILGFGREGKSTYREISALASYKCLAIADKNEVKENLPDSIKICTGPGYMDCIDDYDVVFKSPGIVLDKPAGEFKALITAETDVFLQAFGKKTVGITGTKGKSTTSSMIAHILSENGKNVLFAGNIGIPVFDIAGDVKDDSTIVLEMSCHQLEYARFSPHISVLLNMYEDHLDHYGTREKYCDAKRNIYRNAKAGDVLYTTEETLKECPDVSIETVIVDIPDAPFDTLESAGSTLKGDHNKLNAAFAYKVCESLEVSKDGFLKAFKTFKGLKHRLEFIGNFDGIDYYDDSISTTVKSAISAVESIKNAGVLLLGGMERDLDYTELIGYVAKSRLNLLVFMYASGRRMYEMYLSSPDRTDTSPKAVYADDLAGAVKEAKENALKQTAVILSPAAASYDHFKNFEERGEVFEKLVREHQFL